MRWSWRIGWLAGIELYVHWTFVLLVVWFLFLPLLGASGPDQTAEVVINFLFVLAIFGCVVLHELGHALTARHYGIQTRDITLLPIGGVARLDRIPEDPTQELWVALAGPAVNLVIAAMLFAALALAGGIGHVLDIDFRHMHAVGFFGHLMIANLVLLVFNLLPAFPMDGGRVLRALLARRMDYLCADTFGSQHRSGNGNCLWHCRDVSQSVSDVHCHLRVLGSWSGSIDGRDTTSHAGRSGEIRDDEAISITFPRRFAPTGSRRTVGRRPARFPSCGRRSSRGDVIA